MDKGFLVCEKNNVFHGGKKTTFKIYEWSNGRRAWVFSGTFSVDRWNATDEQCVNSFLSDKENV